MAKIAVFIVLAFVVAAVTAEAPRARGRAQPQRFRGRSNNRFLARQEDATTAQPDQVTDSYLPPEADGGPYPASSGPYPASGWKPAGQRLVLPSRQEAAPPADNYGAPAPETTYGTPTEATTPAAPEQGSPEFPLEVEEIDPQAERVRNQQNLQSGSYYVQLADGTLQRVTYFAAPQNNEIVARIQVQPIVQAQPVLVSPIVTPQQFSFSSPLQQSW